METDAQPLEALTVQVSKTDTSARPDAHTARYDRQLRSVPARIVVYSMSLVELI